MRLRKAYEVEIDGYDDASIYHAPTPSKAKGQALAVLMEFDIDPRKTFMAMRVRRAKHRDIRLPNEHRLVAELTREEQQIVSHAFGENGHRDHYCTDPGDRNLLRLSWELGLFHGPFGERSYGATPGWCGAFFYLTGLGRTVARSMMPTYQ